MFLLLKHLYKQRVRSVFWKKSIVSSVLISIFSLYFLVAFGMMGSFAHKIMEDIYPNKSVLEMFTRFVFSYYLVDFVLRFKFQTITSFDLQHYLFLPFSKKKLFHFPLITSLFSYFNVLAFVILMPYFFIAVVKENSPLQSLVWFSYIYILVNIVLFMLFVCQKGCSWECRCYSW